MAVYGPAAAGERRGAELTCIVVAERKRRNPTTEQMGNHDLTAVSEYFL